MKKQYSIVFTLLLLVTILLISSCTQTPTPTKVAMQGNWQLQSATDASGTDFTSAVAFPITVIQLGSDNGMTGTQGPMFTRVVYGPSQWIQISGKIKQVFDYANLQFNTGEFFVGDNVQTVFTVEAKLQATAALGDLGDILTLAGVNVSFLNKTIYHKFNNVAVTFPDNSKNTVLTNNANNPKDQTMVWEFNDNTTAVYNTKDSQGNYVLWGGWPVTSFYRCKFTFTKVTQSITDVVKAHI